MYKVYIIFEFLLQQLHTSDNYNNYNPSANNRHYISEKDVQKSKKLSYIYNDNTSDQF